VYIDGSITEVFSDTIGNVYKFQASEKSNAEVWVELIQAQKRASIDKGDLIKL